MYRAEWFGVVFGLLFVASALVPLGVFSEIEKEIIQEFMEDLPVIPWFESIEKVTVT